MSKIVSHIGKKFGRLKVLNDGPLILTGIKRRRRVSTSFCRCDCGAIVRVRNNELHSGSTKSCGCWNRDLNRKLKTRHGRSKTKENYIWMAMIQRCRNPNNKAYKNYGGRGITVCDRWLKFENFFEDMGECPSGLSLERIRNSGHYEPSNCKWDTRKSQARNTRTNCIFTVNGKTACLAELCENFHKNYSTTYGRLKRGWSVERAFL